MRNGDYSPTRMANQLDAALMLVNSKRQANIESAISVMTMGGPSPQVLVTLTGDQGKLEAAIASINYAPNSKGCNVPTALQVAQLILKNRQNSNQHQRIVLFNGSPLLDDDLSKAKEKLGTLGKVLRKNGVAVDVVSFGGENISRNEEAFTALLTECAAITPESLEESEQSLTKALSLTEDCECGYLAALPGRRLLELVKESQIYLGYDDEHPQGGSGGSFSGIPGMMMMDEDGMDDADMDPELAMALKMSLDEENARIKRAAAEDANSSGAGGAAADANSESTNSLEGGDNENNDQDEDEDEDEDQDVALARAIAMSMETASNEGNGAKEE